MVAGRRFGPLIVVLGCALVLLIARLWQVQIEEHEIWAREAANLVRSASHVPYLRGSISDRQGTIFVEDSEASSIQFIYRDFRREHPLGQVAHARSALSNHSVSLEQAALHLEIWAFELVESTPVELDRFEAGEALSLAGFDLPAEAAPKARRRSRAGDLRFYIHGLLDLSRAEWRALLKRLKQAEARQLSWLQLAAEVQELSPTHKRALLARRFDTCLGRLEQLARELEVVGRDGGLSSSSSMSFRVLIEALERKRRGVEDAIAVDLFRRSTGFHPGRLDPNLLLSAIDLEWLAARVGWDLPRLDDWARETRRVWLSNWRSFHVPAALIRADLRSKAGVLPLEALVGELSALFARRPESERERHALFLAAADWRERGLPLAFSELDDLFEGVTLDSAAAGISVPSQDPRLRAGLDGSDAVPASLLPMEFAAQVAIGRLGAANLDWRGAEIKPWRPPADGVQAALRVQNLLVWRRGSQGSQGQPLQRPDYRDEEELLTWVAELWRAQFEARLRTALQGSLAGRGELDGAGPRELAAWRLKLARKRADYAIRDRSSRPEELHSSPGEAVVNLLIRFQSDYAGFSILPRTQRMKLALDAEGEAVARDLVGTVRHSSLAELIGQEGGRSSLASIMHQRVRSAADRVQVEALVAQIYLNDELHGTSGIEGLCDSALRGVHGFIEGIGLQERAEAERVSLYKQKIDGLDVQLTLDMDLQAAAQQVIEQPILPADETWRDEQWFENPVGAIVLATVEGEILAAASGPKRPHAADGVRDGERRFAYDRCFHRRRFQPMGSIFKPFVAAFALDRLGLSEESLFACAVRPEENSAGWGSVACGARWGHGGIGLQRALERSCNAYFAQVGELYGDKQTFMEMAHMFGFDRPTGVTDAWDGRGFHEDTRIPSFTNSRGFTARDLHLAGNGLQVLEATPVQVARAVAGLASGRLPAMRLVRAIGNQPVPASFEPLNLSPASLESVRRGMRAVVAVGSASGRGLAPDELGFELAGKTGSADTSPMSNSFRAQLNIPRGGSPEMRKHTWFMGFFPAARPRFVVVVYLHDIGVGASHSAVYVAGQFLKSPSVQALVREPAR